MTWSNSTPIVDILHQVVACVFNKIKLLWYIICFYKPPKLYETCAKWSSQQTFPNGSFSTIRFFSPESSRGWPWFHQYQSPLTICVFVPENVLGDKICNLGKEWVQIEESTMPPGEKSMHWSPVNENEVVLWLVVSYLHASLPYWSRCFQK